MFILTAILIFVKVNRCCVKVGQFKLRPFFIILKHISLLHILFLQSRRNSVLNDRTVADKFIGLWSAFTFETRGAGNNMEDLRIMRLLGSGVGK